MLAGFLQFALRPDSPWLEIFAVAFGVGCGLTLDEFALWLHLEDVYWSEEGRRSIDATIVAAIIGGAVVLGFAPLGAGEDDPTGSIVTVIVTVALDLALCMVALFKGKLWTGLIGFFIPLISLVGAIRAAKPGSPWARRFYKPDSKRMAKARRRAKRSEQRYRRWQDRIGGTPHLPSPLTPAGEEKEPASSEDSKAERSSGSPT